MQVSLKRLKEQHRSGPLIFQQIESPSIKQNKRHSNNNITMETVSFTNIKSIFIRSKESKALETKALETKEMYIFVS